MWQSTCKEGVKNLGKEKDEMQMVTVEEEEEYQHREEIFGDVSTAPHKFFGNPDHPNHPRQASSCHAYQHPFPDPFICF